MEQYELEQKLNQISVRLEVDAEQRKIESARQLRYQQQSMQSIQ
jgi:hypothetical protein